LYYVVDADVFLAVQVKQGKEGKLINQAVFFIVVYVTKLPQSHWEANNLS